MANVYGGGATDARHSSDPLVELSRFRPVYRPLSDEEKALHDKIKAHAVEMEQLMKRVKTGSSRYHSLATTALEESVMWIVKELTS